MFLGYKIELAMSGLVDRTHKDFDWRGCLENLRLRRDAWKNLQWTTISESPLDMRFPFWSEDIWIDLL